MYWSILKQNVKQSFDKLNIFDTHLFLPRQRSEKHYSLCIIVQNCSKYQHSSLISTLLSMFGKKLARKLYKSSLVQWSSWNKELDVNTYIIGQNYWPSFSHNLCCVLVLYISDVDLQFEVDSERQIFFWETFHGNLIYSQSFCQKSAERKSPKKSFLYFVLISGLRPCFSIMRLKWNLIYMYVYMYNYLPVNMYVSTYK